MTRIASIDPDTGLTPQEQRFAALTIRDTLSNAYRQAFPERLKEDDDDQAVAVRASKMAAKPRVIAYARSLVDEAKIQDLETVGHAFKELCDDLQAARDAKNWTATAAFQRLKLQVLGMLKETLLLNMEQTISDEELIKRITGQQPALAALLQQQLGSDQGYAS